MIKVKNCLLLIFYNLSSALEIFLFNWLGIFKYASQWEARAGGRKNLPNPADHGRMNYKDTKPYMSAFLKIDLLTDFAALCLTDFVDWRYIHSVVCIFDSACELLPPWTKELYYTNTNVVDLTLMELIIGSFYCNVE
jgi:hypothetical protein